MKRPVFIVLALLVIAAIALAFNPPPAVVKLLAATDVTAKYAKTSFAEMLASLPGESAARQTEEGWRIAAPDGSAEFFWNPRGKPDGGNDAFLRTPAQPFLEAGLDASRLPDGVLKDGVLTFGIAGIEESHGNGAGSLPDTPGKAFALLVDSYRERVGYHFQLGHFGFELDGGNQIEWASDPKTNSLDLVFVLDPAALLRAGVDGDKVKGWTFGKVLVHDSDSGREVEASKFLKPFDLQ